MCQLPIHKTFVPASYLSFNLLGRRFSVALAANFEMAGGVQDISSKSDSLLDIPLIISDMGMIQTQ